MTKNTLEDSDQILPSTMLTSTNSKDLLRDMFVHLFEPDKSG